MEFPVDFAGLAVGAFESRRADDTERLIEKFHGQPFVSPSMREVPIEKNADAIHMAQELMTGHIDVVLVMTGVGLKHWRSAIEKHIDENRFVNSLKDAITIVRGPKPAAVLKEWGIQATYRIAAPNTWREILDAIDGGISVTNQRVCLQEYGKANVSLIAGLEARGAKVFPLRVYQWAFPEDTSLLEQNVQRLASRQLDIVMFTSAHQVNNVIRMAEQLGVKEAMLDSLNHMLVASIGPTTSEMLNDHDMLVDFEPSHPKLGHLVSETAAQCHRLLAAKRATN